MKQLLISLFVFLTALSAQAGDLVINAAELGIGKFHREDNKIHNYGLNHAWAPQILPDGSGNTTPLLKNNSDGSVTIFYSNLEELFREMVSVSQQTGKKIKVFNMHAHGIPGGMGFPKDRAEQASLVCKGWRDDSLGEDRLNYDHYYSAISKKDILMLRRLALAEYPLPCVTGLSDFQSVAGLVPEVKTIFATDAQINFLSCLVGLGPQGRKFIKGVAELLLPAGTGVVRASVKLGLGDWSIPEGMSFWDYLNDAQISEDEVNYPLLKKDRPFMQKGDVNFAYMTNGVWKIYIAPDQDFMYTDFRKVDLSDALPINTVSTFGIVVPQPIDKVRLPGTGRYLYPGKPKAQ